MMRSEKWKFGFIGARCTNCGTPQLPPQLVCVKCHQRGKMEPYGFADRIGKIATTASDGSPYPLTPPMLTSELAFMGAGPSPAGLTACVPTRTRIAGQAECTFARPLPRTAV